MLMNHDKHKDITEFIHKHEFSGHENDTTPFTFSWTRDEYGNMFVGNGSDEKPFVVGTTTKRLLFRMDRPSNSFIHHLDATFKLNQVDYPVVVCGISDRCRSFHLVALFISSQRTECQYVECLKALRNVYARVTGKSLVVSTVMGDADKAQFNAFTIVFGPDNNYIYLMCFYHLVAKIVERTKGMSEAANDRVFRDIYNIHFSRTMLACVELVQVSTTAWRSDPETNEFAEYFVTQWLKGEFVRWQCFHTAGAIATTNNPVEQFNKKLKRDYTLRQRLKMGTLMKQLLSCCHNESSSERGFRLQVEPSSTIKRRTKELVKLKLLGEVIPPSAVVEAVNSNIKFAASSRPPRVPVAARHKTEDGIAVSAQMGLNYARMEV
ncbi:hypothetical protein PR001_g24508 [Phytophthora rubi]|uniref:MULE transposase domain-containing protein n=1 Tax=Phytophthora rubi TaxID=129364 RepID=A0A6A3I9U3_9STRA|nr:hypothetical protein PR001_g24508 [Phytophthora rubi]